MTTQCSHNLFRWPRTYLAIWSMWSGLLVRELIPSSSLFSPISNSELPAALSTERNLCCSRKAVSRSLRQSSAAVSITALPANTVWESSWWQHSSISNITCTHAVHQLFISEQYTFIIIFYLKMKIKSMDGESILYITLTISHCWYSVLGRI